MIQRGDHTWELYIGYHRCPKCGFILESREDYRYSNGKYEKQLDCPRCNDHYTSIKSYKGPLLGKPEPIEIEWRN